jgi:hypothetical protein
MSLKPTKLSKKSPTNGDRTQAIGHLRLTDRCQANRPIGSDDLGTGGATGHVKVTSNGVCDGKGLATLTDTPANRAVGLPPLQRVSIRDQGQNVTMVFTFQSAPPQTIPGASSYAFFTDVGSGVTNTEGHSTLIVASGGTQLQPGWTVAVTPPGGSIATTSTAVVDDSARSLTASFSVPGLSIPFL